MEIPLGFFEEEKTTNVDNVIRFDKTFCLQRGEGKRERNDNESTSHPMSPLTTSIPKNMPLRCPRKEMPGSIRESMTRSVQG